MNDGEFTRVCSVGEIPEGSARAFRLNGDEIAVVHSDGKFFAISNICTHEHERLHEGWIEGHTIECPRHGAQFDLETGEALSLPATKAVGAYEVKVEGEDVLVEKKLKG